MTQQKNSKKSKKVVKTPSLAERFRKLPQREQEACSHFFNAHNMAHFIYEGLSDDAKSYVTYCIRLSTQADQIEKNNSAQE